MQIEIRELATEDHAAWMAHIRRQAAQSGQDGLPRFDPDPARVQDVAWTAGFIGRFLRPLDQPGWGRGWAAFDGDRLIGHVDLRSNEFRTSQHRAMLGIGIERSHHGKGIGAMLMQHAIGWARAQGLDWLHLCVFAENLPARALYRRYGFVESGIIPDLFRIDGVPVDEVNMVLDLRSLPREA